MKFEVDVDVFGRVFFFYFGKEEYKQFLKDTKTKKAKHEIDGCCVDDHVWIKDASNISVLVHELHHTVTFVTKKLRIKDEETQAYLQEYLLEQVCAKLDMYEISFKVGDK